MIFSSHRCTFQFQPNRIGGDAVHDGISQCGFVYVVIPFCNRELGGDDDRFSLITVFEELEQRQTGFVIERLLSEVIKDDEVVFLDVIDNIEKASVKFGECYALDELVHGEVFHPVLSPVLYCLGCPSNGGS